MPLRYSTEISSGHAQSDGAIELDVNPYASHYQISLEPSATPSAGTATIDVKPISSDNFEPLISSATNAALSIDLTNAQTATIVNTWLQAIRVTPTGFDSDKTYTIQVAQGSME